MLLFLLLLLLLLTWCVQDLAQAGQGTAKLLEWGPASMTCTSVQSYLLFAHTCGPKARTFRAVVRKERPVWAPWRTRS